MAMNNATAKDYSYLVYHFEMGSMDNVYSNIALNNDEVCARNLTNSGNAVCTWGEIIASPNDPRSFDHSAATPRQECFYDTVRTDTKEAKENTIEQCTSLYSIPFMTDDQHDNAVFPPRKKEEKSNCPTKQLNNTRNNADAQKRKPEEKRTTNGDSERDISAHSTLPESRQVGECQCRGLMFLRVMTFLLAAVALILGVMIINGNLKLTCSMSASPGMIKMVIQLFQKAIFIKYFLELNFIFQKKS